MRKSTEPQYICCVNVFECPNQGLSRKCSTVFLKEILMITDLSVLLRVVRNSGSCCPFWVVWKLEIHTYLFMFSFETVRDLLLFWMTNTLKKRGEFRGKKGLIWHQIFKMTEFKIEITMGIHCVQLTVEPENFRVMIFVLAYLPYVHMSTVWNKIKCAILELWKVLHMARSKDKESLSIFSVGPLWVLEGFCKVSLDLSLL